MTVNRDRAANVVLSICCLTYNHEPYITRAIEGFLMQETDFPIEILIHDDASTDGTAEIIRSYEERHPDLIKPIYQTENQYSKGVKPTATFNLPRAKGKYIALCEGDDYWTDPHKLQKQVEYLDNHLECSMCFHNAINLQPDGSSQDYVRRFGIRIKPKYSLTDVLTRNFIPTCSVVLRNELIDEFPQEAYETPATDTLLHVILAQKGRLGYIDEKWAVRRVHPGGVWSRKSKTESAHGNIRCLELINRYLNQEYEQKIRPAMGRHWYDLVHGSLSENLEQDSAEWTLQDVDEQLIRWSRELQLAEETRHYVLGHFCIDLAGMALAAGERSKARLYLLNAVQYYPSVLGEVYMWSHVAEVLLGRRTAGWLRRHASPIYHSRLLRPLRG